MVFTNAKTQQNLQQDFDSIKLAKLRRLEKLKDQVPKPWKYKKVAKNLKFHKV